ncbi:hypothetical protein P3K96_04285 [Treponema pallidum]|nr:hypothetical protein [Treponema pallidum]QUK43573.2 hypothetical protein KEB21_04260 [Treponema pallidum]QUL06804.2 hypothetical protein KEB09_04265 [Treponema pallidum]QUL50437.2 hypothetical protein KEA63_04265 [Treponema pallidum]UZV49430.1 hypothetical protein OSA68_04945 [Treponema pallidum]WBP30405.1 hypothetical protein O9177_04280 [Treponema pallidum]
MIESTEQDLAEFDAGLFRADRILDRHDLYRKTMHQLFSTLLEEPKNHAKHLQLIETLEKLAGPESKEIHEFLNRLRNSSTYAVYAARFFHLMERARILMARQEYLKAALLYRSGYELYYDEYLADPSSPGKKEVRARVEHAHAHVSRAKPLLEAVAAARAQYQNTQKRTYAASAHEAARARDAYSAAPAAPAAPGARAPSAAYPHSLTVEAELRILQDFSKTTEESAALTSLVQALGALLKFSRDIEHTGVVFEQLSTRAQKNNETQEAFLAVARKITLGRSKLEFEGILGALQAPAFDAFVDLFEAGRAHVAALHDQARAQFTFAHPPHSGRNIPAPTDTALASAGAWAAVGAGPAGSLIPGAPLSAGVGSRGAWGALPAPVEPLLRQADDALGALARLWAACAPLGAQHGRFPRDYETFGAQIVALSAHADALRATKHAYDFYHALLAFQRAPTVPVSAALRRQDLSQNEAFARDLSELAHHQEFLRRALAETESLSPPADTASTPSPGGAGDTPVPSQADKGGAKQSAAPDTAQKAVAQKAGASEEADASSSPSEMAVRAARAQLHAIQSELLRRFTALKRNRYTAHMAFHQHSGVSALAEYAQQLTSAEEALRFDAKDERRVRALSFVSETGPQQVSKDMEALDRLLSFFSGEEEFLSERGYAYGLQSLRDLRTQFEQFSARVQTLFLAAEQRAIHERLARQEAEYRYRQAVEGLGQDDFGGARKNLVLSREKADLALSLRYDTGYATETDTRLSTLDSSINRRENELVVKDVRAYIAQAKDKYYKGEVLDAERLLIRAKNRWAVTNVTENGEITNWLSVISTAVALKIGRVIPDFAPLYPQMSQLLHHAEQLYLHAAYLNASQRQEMERLLATSRENIHKVLLVYPLNERAGQLSLRIDQLLDPRSFRQQFAKKLDTIRGTYKTESKKAYSLLLDLYAIDARFSGIEKLKQEVEIYLGVRLPPPNPQAIAQSSNFTLAARRIFERRDAALYQVAIQQLDEALKLNPDNDAAAQLKDRIQSLTGDGAVNVLSSEDEKEYQRALQELQKGNKLVASAVVEQLLQKDRNKKSAKIQQLKKRIDAQL